MCDWMEKETSKWPYDGDCISKQSIIIWELIVLMKLWRVRSTSDAQYLLPEQRTIENRRWFINGPNVIQ